jgi:malate dehydrogenase (oxaloacetate-decarboxylating)
VLDVRASAISDGMARAAAHALAEYARRSGVNEGAILPRTDDAMAAAVVAAAVGVQAQNEGIAKLRRSQEDLMQAALSRIELAGRSHKALLSQGLIRPEAD